MATDSFAGRTVVITGGAGGIGRATALRFLDGGARVVLVDVDDAALAEAASALGASDRVVVHGSALDDHAACTRALDAAGGTVDALVHLAGICEPDPDDPNDASVWDRAMAANSRNGYLVARAFASRHPGTPDDPARIVFASSLAYRRGGMDRVAYSAAKGAITAMVRAFARRYAPTILVNGVAPGIILTRMPAAIIASRGDALTQEIPLRRYGHPREVATVIEFLCGPGSTYVNGQIINIDGGTIHS